MNLSTNQIRKLRHLARLAGELNAEQRARTEAYQNCLDYQAGQRYKLQRLEGELKRLEKTMRPENLKAARTEVESLGVLIEQARIDGQELQRSLEQARAFAGPLNATIDRVVKVAGTSRSALGLNFSVAGAPTSKPDIVA